MLHKRAQAPPETHSADLDSALQLLRHPPALHALALLPARPLQLVEPPLCTAMLLPQSHLFTLNKSLMAPSPPDNASPQNVPTMLHALLLPIHAPVVSALLLEARPPPATRAPTLPPADQTLMEPALLVYVLLLDLLPDNVSSALLVPLILTVS